jgi:hypothetical protein
MGVTKPFLTTTMQPVLHMIGLDQHPGHEIPSRVNRRFWRGWGGLNYTSIHILRSFSSA